MFSRLLGLSLMWFSSWRLLWSCVGASGLFSSWSLMFSEVFSPFYLVSARSIQDRVCSSYPMSKGFSRRSYVFMVGFNIVIFLIFLPSLFRQRWTGTLSFVLCLGFFCIIYNGQIPPVSYKIIVRSVAYDFLLVLHAHKERETLSHLNCNFCTGSARPHTHIDIVDSKHTLPAMCVSIFHQPLSPPDSMQLHSLLHITITDNTFGHLADIITNQGW